MRNLRNTRCGVFRTSAHTPAPITASCWDVARDHGLIVCGPAVDLPRIELLRLSRVAGSTSKFKHDTVASWDAPSPPGHPGGVDSVRCLHYFSDTLTTCVVMAGGDIVTVGEGRLDSGKAAHVEIVGTLEKDDAGPPGLSAITAARWSHDEELLVLATAAGELVFMSRAFDVISHACMADEDLRLSKQVSVGWGKKETQFQGKGAKAKALRDPTIPEKSDVGTPSPSDDARRVTISWRGDGAYLAVNRLEPGEGGRRVIRVYSREGELDSVSEPVDGLEGSLSWRPEGNLLAGIQRRSDDRVDVVFFERNGLRHGQFSLRPPRDAGGALDCISLDWNSDSTVLAVGLRDRVQLWTMGNYHWYLKQEVKCGEFVATADQTPGQQQVPLLAWHAEKPLLFLTATSDRILINEYAFTVSRGPTTPPHDHGAVAVIDGKTLKFTAFRTANVPPPYAMADLEMGDSSIIDVAFAPDSSAMAVLHHGGVSLFGLATKQGRSLPPTLIGNVALGQTGRGTLGAALQITFDGRERICVLQLEDGDLSVLACDLTSSTTKDSATWDRKSADTARSVYPDGSSTAAANLLAQDQSRKLVDLFPQQSATAKSPFPAFMPWIEFAAVDGALVAFGLSRNGHLYADSRQLAKNCTSFLVTDSHLIFTTSNHFVKLVHLTSVENLDVPSDDPEKDERCRSIERRAKLVTAVPTKMCLVLQMPRGNLETIYPRTMVLAGIRKLIEAKEYGAAFSTCRAQRVDMNILYDHRPAQFLENVGFFLEQVKGAANVDLFLSTLKEEDVTKTIYKDTNPLVASRAQASSAPAPLDALAGSKVNTVCDAFLQKLRLQPNANLQNIITAHVCKSPPALDDGLLVVAGLMKSPENEALAERAVEHICFLVDVNKLWDHALGLYDLELALLVAQQAQRDPREYLPLIQELHQMPVPRRQFVIDDRLRHCEKALGHLRAMGSESFDEARGYTVKHGLYEAALRLYRHEEQHHKTLVNVYAKHLASKSKFRDAGLAYESLGNFADAMECYLKAGVTCWRECLFAAAQVQAMQAGVPDDPSPSPPPPLPQAEAAAPAAEEEVDSSMLWPGQPSTDPTPSDRTSAPAKAKLFQTAAHLAEALREAKDFASAATVHLDYLAASDPSSLEAGLSCLCRGYLFADAMRVCALRARPDLLASVVDPGLADAFSGSTEFLADCREQLRAQVPRIAELRRRAREDPLGFYEGDQRHRRNGGGGGGGGEDDDDMLPDDVSVASTAAASTSASLFTRYTGKKGGGGGSVRTGMSRATSGSTSRQRRREEKKRARGRKGTVYEEEYLVNSVRRLVERVERGGAKAEVERLVVGLVRRGMGERARAVEGLMGQVVEACRRAAEEVWPAAGGDTGKGEKSGPAVPASGERDEGSAAGGAGLGDERAAGDTYGDGGVLGELEGAGRSFGDRPVVTDFQKLTLLGSS